MAFLHSLLGQKSFVKEYELFGGTVTVTFRTLTTQELNACYAVAVVERNRGDLINQMEFWERVNRLRLVLSLLSLNTAETTTALPDGLSRATNKRASSYWEDQNMPERTGPDDYGIVHIEKWVLDNVLCTESLNRTVSNAANKFNRLVSKMEVMVDNSDFWKATEEPS